MGIRENIIKLRRIFDITQEELAKVAGVSRGAVSQWEGGFSEPRMSAIQKIADHYGIMKSNIIEDDGMDILDPVTRRPRPQGAIAPERDETAYLPLLGRVHAGDPCEPDELSETVALPATVADSHPRAYFLHVEGDCMDKVYPEGCLILVDPDREPSSGSIAAVSIDGRDAVMRRLLRTPSTIVLAPESFNPEHRDIVVTDAEAHTVELYGTVVWFQAAREME